MALCDDLSGLIEHPVEVWTYIRKLTLQICNKENTYRLEKSDNADEIAEKLCQFVYDMKMDFKRQKDAECNLNTVDVDVVEL